jgi:hypothetical protein
MTLSTDRIDLKLTADGDLYITPNGDIEWTTGLDAVAQAIRIAVQTHKGEVFYDLEEGVPYFDREGVSPGEALLGGKFDEAYALSVFGRVIRSVDDVLNVLALTASFNGETRTLSIAGVVSTSFGDLVLKEQFTR